MRESGFLCFRLAHSETHIGVVRTKQIQTALKQLRDTAVTLTPWKAILQTMLHPLFHWAVCQSALSACRQGIYCL